MASDVLRSFQCNPCLRQPRLHLRARFVFFRDHRSELFKTRACASDLHSLRTSQALTTRPVPQERALVHSSSVFRRCMREGPAEARANATPAHQSIRDTAASTPLRRLWRHAGTAASSIALCGDRAARGTAATPPRKGWCFSAACQKRSRPVAGCAFPSLPPAWRASSHQNSHRFA